RGVIAGEHRDHAGHGERRRDVDTTNTRMRVWRPNEAGVDLIRQGEIVAESPLPCQEPRILLPAHGSAEPLQRRAGSAGYERHRGATVSITSIRYTRSEGEMPSRGVERGAPRRRALTQPRDPRATIFRMPAAARRVKDESSRFGVLLVCF